MLELADVLIPKELLLNKRLSLKAKALMAMILALSGRFSGETKLRLQTHMMESSDTIESGIAELIGKGYIIRAKGNRMGYVIKLPENGGGKE